MEQTYKVRYNFPINVSTITTILVIVASIAIGFIFMYYLRDIDIVDSSEARSHVNNTTDLWVKVAGVVGFVIVISILFYIFKALPKK